MRGWPQWVSSSSSSETRGTTEVFKPDAECALPSLRGPCRHEIDFRHALAIVDVDADSANGMLHPGNEVILVEISVPNWFRQVPGQETIVGRQR